MRKVMQTAKLRDSVQILPSDFVTKSDGFFMAQDAAFFAGRAMIPPTKERPAGESGRPLGLLTESLNVVNVIAGRKIHFVTGIIRTVKVSFHCTVCEVKGYQRILFQEL